MSASINDPEQHQLIEKWRLRHAYPDAVGAWATSGPPESRAFAFNAIAQDPRVLHRAARPHAVRMAAQAEEFALSLPQAAAQSGTWLAAALFVQRSIDAWRRSLKAYENRRDFVTASVRPKIARLPLSDPWEVAQRSFPHVDDETGRLATQILHEFGADVLRRARKPWDHVIALAVLRFAARRLRGEVQSSGASRLATGASGDILTVQCYAAEAGLAPFMVGYSGPGRPAQQALGLFRDAQTLCDAVRASDQKDGERASFWQPAIDFHAYAVVALDHRMLLELPLSETHALAVAAIRQAETAIERPDLAVMPFLPLTSTAAPEVVRLHAMASLK